MTIDKHLTPTIHVPNILSDFEQRTKQCDWTGNEHKD